MGISPRLKNKVARFGLFEVDFERFLLKKGGLKVKLQDQPFQILALLLDRPGEIVSREEIRQELWPDNTFVEFDGGLNTAIKKLRTALNDSADTPRFIETIPRRGYRFLAPVEFSGGGVPETGSPKVGESSQPAEVATESSAPSRTQSALDVSPTRLPFRAHKSWMVLALGILCVLIVGYAVWQRKMSEPPIRSIAILPLQSLSSDPTQEYFSDGMTDEIITDLAKIRSLRVISRTSMMRYKGTSKSIPEVARELQVDAVLEGSVSRSPDHIHIRAQLIRANPEEHIWAESYDRPLTDEVTLQGELAQQIANAIRAELTAGERAELSRPRPVDPETHSLYLKGRYFWNKRTPDGYRRAIEFFQAAIQRDPNYAVAYAGMADAIVFLGDPAGQRAAAAKARPYAERALQLDDQLAEAEASLGLIARDYNYDWPEMQTRLKRALEINPNYATAHQWLADAYLAPEGRLKEALVEARKAQELDPLSPIIAADVAKQLYFLREYDEAIAQLKKVLELDPEFVLAHVFLQRNYMAKGMYAEASAELESVKDKCEPELYLAEKLFLQAHAGQKKEAQLELQQLLGMSSRASIDPAFLAGSYSGLEDRDNAFQWLEKAREWGSPRATSIKVDMVWDPLRSDPRYPEFVKAMRLDHD